MPVSINGTTGVTAPEVTLDNATADGGQVVLSSSGFSNWNLDNFSGRLRAYYGSTEYLTLTNAGNLGVGTSSPGARLHVFNASGNTQARVYTPNGTSASLEFSSDTYNYINAAGGAPLGIQVGGTERARIDSSGNLLVGKTSSDLSTPGFGVDVRSGVLNGVSIIKNDSTWGTALFIRRNTGVGTGAVAEFNYNGTTTGTIGITTTNTAYNTSSDYRLKEQVQPMTGALAKVQALKPCTYKWKVDGSDGEGFIAHELAEVVPQCVTGEKDAVGAEGNPVYQGIDTSFLVATLTAAIQELHAQHIELKAIVDQQATEIANLKGQA